MGAPARLGLYGLVLVVVFAVAGFTANAVVPETTVQNWVEETAQPAHQMGDGDAVGDGYRLAGLSAPAEAGVNGELSLTVTGTGQQPVTNFETDSEQSKQLIVARADGQHLRGVQPSVGDDGTWSTPWRWDAPGSYRVIANFVPTATGEATTLSTSVEVAQE